MRAAIEQFRENIKRARHLGAIHSILKAQTTTALDLSDILRAELVMVVSALDHYVHEIVRLGMLEAYQGERNKTQQFLRFSLSLENTLRMVENPNDTTWLEEEIRLKHSYQSFQQADKIAEAIRLISDSKLWIEVAKIINVNKTDQLVKKELDLIAKRRNQIAHEADIQATPFGNRWEIDEPMVEEAVQFIEKVAEAIYQVISVNQNNI
jgi:hypothetical protein